MGPSNTNPATPLSARRIPPEPSRQKRPAPVASECAGGEMPNYHPSPWHDALSITIAAAISSQPGQYRTGEFGLYDGGGKLILTTGALDVPKRLAHVYDNPWKLSGFSASEKAYLQSEYNLAEDRSAPLTTLRMVDLRRYPRYRDEPTPKTTNTHPFIILVDNIVVDFIGLLIRTSPSRTRVEAIDKMFGWLASPTPGIDRNRITLAGVAGVPVTDYLNYCLDNNHTRLSLPSFRPIREDDTPSVELAGDLKTYLNSSDPLAGLYFVRALGLLERRYQKHRHHLTDPIHTVENVKATRACQNGSESCCYDWQAKALKPLYGHIEYAFDYQTLRAILRDATDDADVLDILTDLVTPETGKTEAQRLSETRSVSFEFNFKDPQSGYLQNENTCYLPINGPRNNITYTKRWLLGILQRHIRQFALNRDWANMYQWHDRVEREHRYALWRRRPLIDYATHAKSSEFSAMWSSGYCFPTEDFRATDSNGKNVVDIALGEKQGAHYTHTRWGLANSIANWNNLYRYIGENLPRRKAPW